MYCAPTNDGSGGQALEFGYGNNGPSLGAAGQNRGGAVTGKLVEWRDHCGSGGTGRRARLRILWPKGRGGSTPSFRTNNSI
jgi:hypothetical protein